MANLSLNGIIDVNVQLTPTTAFRRGFNTALIIGPYVNSSLVGVQLFENIGDVLETFGEESEIYKTAAIYFGQQYVPGGVYCATLDQTTSGGQTINETLLEAITRCRAENYEWYACIPTPSILSAIGQSDYATISTYVEAAEPATIIGYTLTDSSTYVDILTALKGGNFSKTISMYDNVVVNTADAGKAVIAAPIGYALGRNNSNSTAYTLAYKGMTGITPDTSISVLGLQTLLGLNGNIYVNQGHYYDLFRQGHMASGDSFDEIMYIDMLIADIKTGLMNVLINTSKVPQTEQGISILEAGLVNVLEQYRDIEFIAPGVWNGEKVIALNNGDFLPAGYLIQFMPISSQTLMQRVERIAPPCYICIKLAGAIEHLTVSVIVDK